MKAAIVRRVSTTKEIQEQSLKNQQNFFEDYVKSRGWDIFDIYTETESGTKFNRKEMNRLIADAKMGRFDIILAKELSRLARNQRLAHEIKDVIETYNIHLITMDGAIDTTNGNTNMFGLYAWIYEQEAQRTSERIKMALTTRAKQGRFKGSIPPYGYELREGKLVVKEDNSPEVVRLIFQRYIEGKGFDAIARELFEAGVPTPSMVAGKSKPTIFWNGSSVRSILENPHYTGNMVQGRESTVSVTNKARRTRDENEFIVVQDTHEPIIASDQFETVQQLIAFNRRRSFTYSEVSNRPHQIVHLFTGIIFCADCGSGFHYKRNSRGYICGRSDKHGDKACTKHRVREDNLIDLIQNDLQRLAGLFDDKCYYDEVRAELMKSRSKLDKELQSCNAKIDRLNNLKRKALSKYLEEEISKSQYDDYIAAQDAEGRRIQGDKERLEAAMLTVCDPNSLERVKEIVALALEFKDINREVINRVIEKIEVREDGTVRLYYRFAGTSKILNELL